MTTEILSTSSAMQKRSLDSNSTNQCVLPDIIKVRPYSPVAKRAFDLAFVTFSAPVWVVLMLGLAAIVGTTSRGGVFYIQKRRGRDGREIRVFKFRSMLVDADQLIYELIENDDDLLEEWTVSRKLKNDPRVTTVGRFLRASSLDELPQILNVLVGNMSLVGPRPFPQYHLEDAPESFVRARESVLPGMTGLWQVSDRDGAIQKVIDGDLGYLASRSVWFDLKILLTTVGVVFKRTGC